MGNFKQNWKKTHRCYTLTNAMNIAGWVEEKNKKTFGVAENGSARACHLLPSKIKGTRLIRVIEVVK